jgi:hypothetical protein
MHAEDYNLVEFLLRTDDPLLIKRGLQFLCDKLESGGVVSYEQKRALLRLLSVHQRSTDLLVRRWLYKALGHLPERSNLPFLEGQFRVENDFENLTWIVAALARIQQSLNSIVRLVESRDFTFYDSAFELALGYFNERYRPSYSRLRQILAKGDATALLWVSLVYGISGGHIGEDRGDPKVLVRDLNLHENAQVTEYSIWGLYKADTGSFADLAIPPQNLLSFSPNVRRWYYRLLTKVPEALDANFDLMEEAIRTERSSEAREGLAIGLATIKPDVQIARLMMDWYGRERNALVRAKLLEHFARFHSYRTEYRAAMAGDQDLGPYERRLIAVAESAGEPLAIELQNRHRVISEETVAMTIPMIGNENVRTSYILAVDTVNFSGESDTIQLALFRDLLQDFGTDQMLHGVRKIDFIALLTGDGLIVVASGEDNRLLPLRLSLSILERYERTRGKKIRCGVNSGPAHWIELSDGTRQVIGHAVNWAARIMAAAEGNEVLLSDAYYREIAQPARSELRGIKFEQVEGLRTKKDESIPAWRAAYLKSE